MLQLSRKRDEVIYVGDQFRIITRLSDSVSIANVGIHASPQLEVARLEILHSDRVEAYDRQIDMHLSTITVPTRGAFFLGEDCLVRLLNTTAKSGKVGFEVWSSPGQAAYQIKDRPDHALYRVAMDDRKRRA